MKSIEAITEFPPNMVFSRSNEEGMSSTEGVGSGGTKGFFSAKAEAAHLTLKSNDRHMADVEVGPPQSLSSTTSNGEPQCSFPALSLFGVRAECASKAGDSSSVAIERATKNLSRRVRHVRAVDAPNVLARNTLSSFQCLVHANFMHVAKSHLQSMKRLNKIVDGRFMTDERLAIEAKQVVSTVFETPRQLLDRAASDSLVSHPDVEAPTSMQQFPVVVSSASTCLCRDASSRADSRGPSAKDVPILFKATFDVVVAGTRTSIRMGIKGSMSGRLDDSGVLRSVDIHIDTRQFLAKLRQEARHVVLQAVSRGLLQAPQQLLRQNSSLRPITQNALHMITPPSSPGGRQSLSGTKRCLGGVAFSQGDFEKASNRRRHTPL